MACGCLRSPNAVAFLVWISYTETGAWKRSQLASDPGTFGKFPGRRDRRTISGTIPGIPERLASLPYSSCICSFLQQHPYFLFIFKCFSFLLYLKVCKVCIISMVCVCLSNLPPHTLETQKRDTNRFIAIPNDLKKVIFVKTFSFKSYGVICSPRAAPASYIALFFPTK